MYGDGGSGSDGEGGRSLKPLARPIAGVYRIDRPPEEGLEWTTAAMEMTGVEGLERQSDRVTGRTADGQIVAARVGAPVNAPMTVLSVTTVSPDGGAADPPAGLLEALERASEDGVEVQPVPGAVGPETEVAVEGWADCAAHPAVTATGRYSLGRVVHETTVDGRVVTAALERADGAVPDVGVAVATPLQAVRSGVVFEYYYIADDLVRDEFGDPPDLPADVVDRLRALPDFGTLTVHDRLGLVKHVLDPVTDPERLREQARAVVAVARAVEAAVGDRSTVADD